MIAVPLRGSRLNVARYGRSPRIVGDLAPGHLTERRDTELGAAAQGRGQLDGAVAGEGVDRGAERRDVLTVEGLGPVKVVALTAVMAA